MMKNDNLIRCGTCGVILIDPRKRKIRSCPHEPLAIEEINGKPIITLGVAKRDNAMKTSDETFNQCFNNLLSLEIIVKKM